MSENKFITKKFPKEFMLEEVLENDGPDGVVISDEIVDTSRWAIQHELIFKYEGQFWKAFYQVGATEMQDESPWEDEDFVECYEVEPYNVTVTRYRNIEKSEIDV